MAYDKLIDEYLAGPEIVSQAVAGMSELQLDARPVSGQWSTREVVCHIADFETIYADRIKRVLAEDQPTLFGADPDSFASCLTYGGRSVENELQLIHAVRHQLATILRGTDSAMWQRTGRHSEDGPLSVETLLRRVTDHIPHHVRFIRVKRDAM